MRTAKGRSVSHNAGDAVPWSAIAVRMIPVINEELTRLLGEYKPIRPDNRGSHTAGIELERWEVDPEWCEQRLRLQCRTFNVSKHGGGQPPRSLGYFLRGLLRDWQEAVDAQYKIPLIVRNDAPAPGAAAVHEEEQLPDPAPASDPTRWRREISLERKDLSRIGADDVRKASGG